MATSTVENYIKQLYFQEQMTPERLVSMGKLAAAMEVTPGTATAMIKALSNARLVHYEPRSGVRLSPGGKELALHVLRRHRLVELFLVETLGLDWSQVHEEAEKLEHVISDRVLERIDELLGHPQTDPHGDPIPSAQGQLATQKLKSLADCAAREVAYISRIIDQDARFLKFADKNGLIPGQKVKVSSHDDVGESLVLQIAKAAPVTLGLAAASKILVQSRPPGTPA